MPSDEARDFWEQRYAEQDQMWSGRPNVVLVEEIEGMAPGSALDLGCGEGADSIWLAERGWRVTAADISQLALDRAALHAADAGVADRITWERHDFTESFPHGVFDLVSAHFLHSPVADPRESVLPRAADAVAPGGTLLIVSHESMPWHPEIVLPAPAEVLESVRIAPDAWMVERLASRPRRAQRDGQEFDVEDSVVRLRRS